ncbi:ABATE domain-containing protein [Nonomuraea thailandensis]
MAANDAWIRDGGRVCLDFVNTLRDRWDVPRETIEEPEDLVRWLHGAGLVVPGHACPHRPAPRCGRPGCCGRRSTGPC